MKGAGKPKKDKLMNNAQPDTVTIRVFRSRSDDHEWWTSDIGEDGTDLDAPEGWEFLLRGDAYITRKVKSLGPHWVVLQKGSSGRGRRRQRFTSSIGILAPRANIEEAERMASRTAKDRAKKRAAGGRSRKKVEERRRKAFETHIIEYLDFAAEFEVLALKIAKGTAEHAMVVGSGRVGRTLTVEEDEKARMACRAHIRHNIIDYDDMYHKAVDKADEDGEEITDWDDSYPEIREEAELKVTLFIERHRKRSREINEQ